MRMRDVWVFPFLFLFSSAFSITLPLHSVSAAAVLTTSSRHYLSNIGERDALLQFINSFNITKNASAGSYCDELSSVTSHSKTASWKNGTDFCSWDGVTCHIATNQVIGLDLSCSWLRGSLHSNSTLFSLPSLRRLNLAGNDFSGSPISPSFGIFTGMTHLNLSYSRFSGSIPLDVISHFSLLITLDLSHPNTLTIGDDHSFRRLVGNLTQLRELALDGVDMSRISLVSLSNLSSTLTSLSLQRCSLTGTLPNDIFHLPHLRSLSLSGNLGLMGTLPQTNWSISSLVSLVLSDTKFHGPIPATVGNLTSMKILDLSYAKFTGHIPLTLGNLAHLTYLDLGANILGSTTEFEMFARLKSLEYLSLYNLSVLLRSNGNCSFPMLKVLKLSRCRLTSTTFPYFLSSSAELEELDLSGSMIGGKIPDWIGRVGRDTLTRLDLSSNNFTREIPSSVCQLSSLNYLHLFDNGFSGSIPRCIGNLSNLLTLDASNNSFIGEIPSSVCQVSSIIVLRLSNNRLDGSIPSCLGNLSNLLTLDASNNIFTGEIPSSVCRVSSITALRLSSNRFGGTIPSCLGNLSSLEDLDLGDNRLQGRLPQSLANCTRLAELNVSYNRISDTFPQGLLNATLHSLISLNLQSNKFHGDISLELCNATQLYLINLSNNSLTGTIPPCLINLNVSVLVLCANKFVGQIPDVFFPGNMLRTIRMSRNQLEGTLPRSLVHCKKLEVLDLSQNELGGRFPYWLDTFPNLQVLVLRSNKFHGPVKSSSKSDHPFPKLRIFDLSNNRLSGPLPAKYIAKLKAMKNEERSGLHYMNENSYYKDAIEVVIKGMEIELVKILTIFTTIDFSSNCFGGEIPELIGDLKALKGLNFSHNNLTGSIPPSVGNLTNLEWLDLSSNKLNGEIPGELADVTFLTTLNLSNNLLSGPIPKGPQIDTFVHSFDGNPGLCGCPLPKACGLDVPQSPPTTSPAEEEEKESAHWIECKAVAIGYGSGLVIGISAGYVMLEIGRPRWLVRMVERWVVKMVERKRRRKTTTLKRDAAPRNHPR
ncbi:hypothetical protein CDL15_Pgr012157 [Punica granatum]|nr:hypothetical protein CDL15_Pgr012157 [Punica granatum]